MLNRLGALLAVIGIAVACAIAPSSGLADPKGTIEFGTGGTECSLTDRAATFPASATFRLVAYLQRPLHAGEANSMRVTGPAGTDEWNNSPPLPFVDCIYNAVYPGFAPGHYAIEMRAGSEVLAKGAFDITP
jgi:hypothetical protein